MSYGLPIIAIILALVSFGLTCCNFNKAQPDEMVSLTDEVLRRNEGIEIDVKPLPKDKK